MAQTALDSHCRHAPPSPDQGYALVDSVWRILKRGLLEATGPCRTATAPVVPLHPQACARAYNGDPVVSWQQGQSSTLLGLGATAVFNASGPERFRTLRQNVTQWVQHHRPSAKCRFLGGFSFVPGGASEPSWAAFGDARFVLPRWIYEQSGQGTRLTLTTVEDWSEEELREELSLLLNATWEASASPQTLCCNKPSEELFTKNVQGIRAGIQQGFFSKVVAAHRTELHFTQHPDVWSVQASLAKRFSECTTFAFQHGQACFLGATPELLVRLEDGRVFTEALAGSMRTKAGAAEQLLNCEKNRQEHEFVVRDLEARLSAVADQVQVGPRGIRTLPNVIHLRTPFSARARAETHVLDLVEAFHPTSAVGGVPRSAALDWIAAHESTPRGWYSAPVGWFDAAGRGEFTVAIRSGLFEGSKAWLYAGAGIVRDSVPEQEYQETELKLRALSLALELPTAGER